MSTAQAIISSEAHLLDLNWPLNAHWAEETVKSFKALADRGAKRIIVNMENVPFIDSHGLAALVTGAKLLGDDLKALSLDSPQAQARWFLGLTKFDKVFDIRDSFDKAK